MSASVEEIRGWLQDANVSIAARRTTMALSNFMDIKAMVDEERLWVEGSGGEPNRFTGLILYPEKGSCEARVRLAGHLLAKDTILMGWRKINVISLANIIDDIKRTEGYWLQGLRKYNAVVVMDFYNHEITGLPFSKKMQHKVETTILHALEHGVGVTVCSTKPLVEKEGAWSWHWYTGRFLKTLSEHNISVGVKNV